MGITESSFNQLATELPTGPIIPTRFPAVPRERRRWLDYLTQLILFAILCITSPLVAQTSVTTPPTPAHMFEHGWKSWWLPPNHSHHGTGVDWLFTWTFIITMAVFVVVEIVLIIFVIRYRARPDKKKGVFSHGNTKLELTWTIIPAIILSVLSLYGVRVWNDYRYGDESRAKDAVNVLVVGEQFQWNFVYPGPDNKIGRYFAFPHTTDPKYRKYSQSEVLKKVNADISENPLGQFQASDAVQEAASKFDAALADSKSKLSAPALAALEARNGPGSTGATVSPQVTAELAKYDEAVKQLSESLSRDAAAWIDTRDDDYATQPGRPLILPVETPIQIALTAKDVIHDFFMPNMRVKLDAVPGTRGIINFTADKQSLSLETKKLTDPGLTDLVEGAPPLVWVDAHTPGAAKMPDNSYALVDPKNKTIPLVAGLTPTPLTPELVSQLKAAGIDSVTLVTKKWSVVCEQLCGVGHTTMRGSVIFVTPQQYWDFIHKPDISTTRPSGVAGMSNTPLAAEIH